MHRVENVYLDTKYMGRYRIRKEDSLRRTQTEENLGIWNLICVRARALFDRSL
jgi:hypothetical protein